MYTFNRVYFISCAGAESLSSCRSVGPSITLSLVRQLVVIFPVLFHIAFFGRCKREKRGQDKTGHTEKILKILYLFFISNRHGPTDGWINGWMDRRTNRRTNKACDRVVRKHLKTNINSSLFQWYPNNDRAREALEDKSMLDESTREWLRFLDYCSYAWGQCYVYPSLGLSFCPFICFSLFSLLLGSSYLAD